MSKWLILRARAPGVAEPQKSGAEIGPRQPEAARPRSSADPGLAWDWLFTLSTEPVIIIETSDCRIVQANPAAARLLEVPRASLLGRHVAEVFDTDSTQAILNAINAPHNEGATDALIRHGQGQEFSARVSIFNAENVSYLLLRLAALGGAAPPAESPVFEAIEDAAVGFLLTDSALRIEYANQSFLEMIERVGVEAIRGQSLVRWLELSQADLTRLRDQMLQREAVSLMVMRLRTERGFPREVEVCAIAVPDDPHTSWGFTIRELPRLN